MAGCTGGGVMSDPTDYPALWDAIVDEGRSVEALIAAVHTHRSRLRGNGRDPQVWDLDLWRTADDIAGGTPRQLAAKEQT